MKNNTKGFVAVLVVLVIGVVTLGSALFLTSWIRDRTTETEEEGWDLVDYVAEITDIELGDLYCKAEGEVEIDYSEGYSEFAYIRISLFNGATETIEERFAERGREMREAVHTPSQDDYGIAQILSTENCIGVYGFFDDGWNGAKTRSMEMYLTTDDEGNEYLYFFG